MFAVVHWALGSCSRSPFLTADTSGMSVIILIQKQVNIGFYLIFLEF